MNFPIGHKYLILFTTFKSYTYVGTSTEFSLLKPYSFELKCF